jgi:Flp pilus assembly protein TadB
LRTRAGYGVPVDLRYRLSVGLLLAAVAVSIFVTPSAWAGAVVLTLLILMFVALDFRD